ncbi:MAG: DsbA family protein [Proteobacteria bacterium]|nr:MAG: DsbA family protein [Pseudomonadota bacterium]
MPIHSLKTQLRNILTLSLLINSLESSAKAEEAFKIGTRTYSVEEISKEQQGRFYDLELKKFETIDSFAKQKYLEQYFQKIADAKKQTVEQAREGFLKDKAKPTTKEKKDAIAQFGEHPSLKSLSPKERDSAILNYIEQTKGQEALREILTKAVANKDLSISYPEPKEPRYNIALKESDFVRFGPEGSEQKSQCKGDDCAITIVEYSEFQCPYCERALPATQEILKEYKGKIRWVVRDYPIPSHDRSKPAAIAAHCAGEQGKYWAMYSGLFKNQRTLGNSDISRLAQSIGLDSKAFESCQKNPDKVLANIQGNIKSGEQFGVTGTPTFFINGKRISGAIPASEFKRIIAETSGK